MKARWVRKKKKLRLGHFDANGSGGGCNGSQLGEGRKKNQRRHSVRQTNFDHQRGCKFGQIRGGRLKPRGRNKAARKGKGRRRGERRN